MNDRGIQFGFIGCGQGGGKIVDLFALRGYKTIAVNTSPVDLAALAMVPAEHRIRIGTRLGAGKDPRLGQEAVRQDAQKIRNVIFNYFLSDVDYVFVVACLGGGTGTGIAADMVELARQAGLPTGCITTIPLLSESLEEQKNAIKGFDILTDVNPLPLMLIDNQLLRLKFGNQPVLDFWTMANETIVRLLDEINQLPNRPSNIYVFDREDFFRLLNTPGCFTPLKIELKLSESEEPARLSAVFREEVVRILTENNFQGESSRVAALLVCPENYPVNAEAVELIYQECQNLTNAPTLFRGLYRDGNLQDTVTLYLILAGLNAPLNRLLAIRERLQELSSEIIHRLNRPVTTNFSDGLEDWELPAMPSADRRSFGSVPSAGPGKTEEKNPKIRTASSQTNGAREAVESIPSQITDTRTSFSPSPVQEETTEGYKILTVEQVLNLMDEAESLSQNGSTDRNFWNQLKPKQGPNRKGY